jgi:DMSO/TMAO reductase YedYZ molybdopterin-dependent catalytic subunit
MSAAGSTTRRVQRVTDGWPVVHLEAEIPDWPGLLVEGLVRHPRALSLADLHALGAATHVADFHCVWGWSRRGVTWEGVSLAAVLDLAGVERAGDAHVTVTSASDTYSACLTVAEAARGFLAWARDGETLAPVHGGPLRYVSPPDYWAYKDVKWATRVTVRDGFRSGFWEAKVADPVGRIPEHEVQLS